LQTKKQQINSLKLVNMSNMAKYGIVFLCSLTFALFVFAIDALDAVN